MVLPVTSARARCGCGCGGRRGRIRCIARRCGLGRWGRCVRSRWSRRVSCTSTSVECGWRGAAAKWLGHRAPRASERGTGRPWRVRLRARSPSFACRRCQRQPKTDQWTACRALFSFQMPSTAVFGRRARRSRCHCAMTARYTSCPPRSLRSGAVLGRSSTENDPDAQAISRTPVPIRAADRDLLSLSKGQIVAECGSKPDGGMPPTSRNRRDPTAGDTPASTPASSLLAPPAIASPEALSMLQCRTNRVHSGRRGSSERQGSDCGRRSRPV